MSKNSVIFVLSTGRCGTQRLYDFLLNNFNKSTEVAHEPLDRNYNSRKSLGIKSVNELPNVVSQHIKKIEEILESRNYIECGHPSWGHIPLICDYLQDRVKIVHLTRHPITNSISWLTHSAYVQPILPHLPEKVLIAPDDIGVNFPEYIDKWNSISAYEKCLYYWLEVNTFGLKWESQFNVPWKRIQYEKLFTEDSMDQLIGYLGIQPNKKIDYNLDKQVDEYRYLTAEQFDIKSIHKHKEVVDLASELGYKVNDVNESAIRKRYSGY